MMSFIFSLVCSFLATLLIVHSRDLHSHLSADCDLSGVQKFHSTPVPRIGGTGIFLAIACSSALIWVTNPAYLHRYLQWLTPTTLVFAIGFLEDLTKRVSVLTRLIFTMLAALLGSFLLNATIRSMDIPEINSLLQINLIAIVFTMVAVAGVANAVNLIDGFNGLAGGISVMALLTLGFVAHTVGDLRLFSISMTCAGAITGFLLWNYPRAQIFLGDGGAYMIGFVIAEVSVLLNERYREVSALLPLLVMIYPVFETLFTIYRRKFVRGRSPGAPDALHLHQLINKRVVRWRVKAQTGSIRARGNAATSPYLWTLNLLAVVPAVLFWDKPAALLAFIFLFMVAYVWLYRSIVRFRTPRWLFFPFTTLRHSQQSGDTVVITSNTAWSVFNFRLGLIKTLQQHGYRVIVFAPYDEYAPRLVELGCQYVEVQMQNSGTNPLKDLGIIRRYSKLLKEHKPAVLLTFTPKPNIYGALAARIAGIPVISNVSGLGRAFIHRNWVTVIVERLYRLALKHPAKVFFQNADDKSIFLELGFVIETQAELLPGSGVDTKKFVPIMKAAEPKAFVFILVARMLRDKGVGEFVDAARIVKKIYPETRFQLVGFLDIDNPSAISREQMDKWIREGVIEYTGPTDNVRQYLSQADCAVLPSYREGTPRTLLEAASMALPIITTDAPGCRDTIDAGITGYMCGIKDVDGLAKCMFDMLKASHEERNRMGMAGREKMRHQFDEEIVFNAYLNAIQKIPSCTSQPASFSRYTVEQIDSAM